MNEIGSDFWDICVSNKDNEIFNNRVQWYLTGRVALNAIIKDIKKTNSVSKAVLPSWCCESMIVPFLMNGIQVEFYEVYYENGRLVQEYPSQKGFDVIVLMNYFGYSQSERTPKYDRIIIRDETHSIFSKSYFDADYYFGSLRKWDGFLTGGFAYKREGVLPQVMVPFDEYVELRSKAMNMKRRYIIGQTESKRYLNVFGKAERLLNNIDELYCAENDDINKAYHLDIDFLKGKRRQNAEILIKALNNLTMFNLSDTDCPIFVPIRIENREELKARLISEKVYCPCHWGISEEHVLNEVEQRIYQEELSLVCDQRYERQDMEHICEIVKKVAVAC